jgi:hypothetical protein
VQRSKYARSAMPGAIGTMAISHTPRVGVVVASKGRVLIWDINLRVPSRQSGLLRPQRWVVVPQSRDKHSQIFEETRAALALRSAPSPKPTIEATFQSWSSDPSDAASEPTRPQASVSLSDSVIPPLCPTRGRCIHDGNRALHYQGGRRCRYGSPENYPADNPCCTATTGQP